MTQADRGEQLRSNVSDAATKVVLLKKEVAFNETLVTTLKNLRGLRQTVDLTEAATQKDNFLDAVALLEKAEDGLGNMKDGQNTQVAGLLQAKITDLRYTLIESLTDCWKTLLYVDSTRSIISISNQIQSRTAHTRVLIFADRSQGSAIVRGHVIVQALSKLGLLKETISSFSRDLDTVILKPRLQLQEGGTVHSVIVDDNAIRTFGELADLSIEKLFADMNSIVNFLRTRLPPSISTSLAAWLMPNLVRRLISSWLVPQVPVDVEGIKPFQTVLGLVVTFARTLDSIGWPGNEMLLKWTNEIPEVWFNKRREISLDKIRRFLVKGIGSIERVDRFETQILSYEDNAPAGSDGRDAELSAEPTDEDGTGPRANPRPSGAQHNQPVGEEEDDVSAWGLDEDADEESTQEHCGPSFGGNEARDEDADAWGWGDNNDDNEASRPSEPSSPDQKKAANGLSNAARRNSRELTLKETYNITALPRQILEIITQIVHDAEMLRKPE